MLLSPLHVGKYDSESSCTMTASWGPPFYTVRVGTLMCLFFLDENLQFMPCWHLEAIESPFIGDLIVSVPLI